MATSIVFDLDACLINFQMKYDPASAFEATMELAFYNQFQQLPWDGLFVQRVIPLGGGDAYAIHWPQHLVD